MTIVKTRNLNQASFLTAWGAELIEVTDRYPNNLFVISAHPLLLWYERHWGWIPYRKYCNQRVRLKERGRRLANLPKHFTGKSEGFNFLDVAHVKPAKKGS